VSEVRDTGRREQPFDFELMVTRVALVATSGIRARQDWQDPSMAKWEVSVSDPADEASPSVSFRIDDSQKEHFHVGRRVKVTIEPN
jgi:hypothetical protein